MEQKEVDLQALGSIVEPLLVWYGRHARVLPWREQPTPYRVWVSEIMLQQTRVEAVKPYFERFLKELPDIPALAACEQERLLKLWEGLGYYSRVRNLQKAAQAVMEQYDGQLPADYQKLKALPGIGPYTAGAVASIAYGIPVPAVDGNVLRVTARVLNSRADIASPAVKKQVEQAVGAVMPQKRAGDFNQALMELGATVCLPNGVAKCEECPLRELCGAYRQHTVMELPVKAPKKARRIERRTVLVLLAENRVALRRRPEQGLLAGMWELPNGEGSFSPQQITELVENLDAGLRELIPLGEAKHIFTHIEWHMTGYAVRLERCVPHEGWAWANKREIEEIYALPGAFKAYAAQLKNLL